MVDRDVGELREACSNLGTDRVTPVEADLTDRDVPARLASKLRGEAISPVSILINNAGIGPKHNGKHLHILDISLQEWDAVLAINLTAAMLMTRQFLPGMRDQRWGRVINMSSSAARGASIVAGPAYMASKIALIGLTRHVASQFAKDGITANAVAPGRVPTELSMQSDPETIARATAMNPTGRLGRVEEVAATVGFLASEGGGYCNGVVIDVNGGVFMT